MADKYHAAVWSAVPCSVTAAHAALDAFKDLYLCSFPPENSKSASTTLLLFLSTRLSSSSLVV